MSLYIFAARPALNESNASCDWRARVYDLDTDLRMVATGL